MRAKPPPNYLAAYPATLIEQVQQLIAEEKFAGWILQKYPLAHDVRTDRALYDFVQQTKDSYLRNTGALSRVAFDGSLQLMRRALGMHSRISQVQGINLKTRREIQVAAVFREMPLGFLRMIVVHELAHLKEREHNKAFYQLCLHMEADYHQLEFELRAYLTYLDATGKPLWGVTGSR